MVFIYPGFYRKEVFSWTSEDSSNRYSVCFSSEDDFEFGFDLLSRKHDTGMDIMAWGDEDALRRLTRELDRRGMTYDLWRTG